MKFSMALVMFLSVTLPMISLAAEITKTAPLPLETFYRGERIEQLSLSPNGKRLIALKNLKEFTAIQLIDIESGQTVYLAKTDNKKYRFAWVRWANNSHVLVSFRFGAVRSVGIGRGAKTHETRLFAMEAKAGAEFIPMVKPAKEGEYQSQFQDDVVKFRFPDDDHFLLGLDRQMAGHDSLYKINVKTGDASMIKNIVLTLNPGWWTDKVSPEPVWAMKLNRLRPALKFYLQALSPGRNWPVGLRFPTKQSLSWVLAKIRKICISQLSMKVVMPCLKWISVKRTFQGS
ncbi:hypothetical protein [Rheinheimera mangrovi]|uniref:hypothetical protein n=1 Tax=Rheinheimera mangrovi TaxID=2498451 RepID=UPI001E402C21|nr:hypothetical protein [Rheinheimera mangrovi]